MYTLSSPPKQKKNILPKDIHNNKLFVKEKKQTEM